MQRETAVAAVVDGCWGFGPVVMEKAVDLGLEKAAHAGIAALTVRHANHIGRLGGYVERIARQEMVGLLFVNMHGGGVIVVPWGGAGGEAGNQSAGRRSATRWWRAPGAGYDHQRGGRG